MKIDLSGKTALVTGSTDGIGLAVAQGLAAAGARVLVNGRSQEGVERAMGTIRGEVAGADLLPAVADVSRAEGAASLAGIAEGVDILVNNAGIYGLKPFFQIEDDLWETFFHTNVMSAVRMSRALMPGMLDRGWGRIVFISSESGINIPADMIHYGFTKSAMLSISRGLAKLARGTDVTVNAVLPGPTLTRGVGEMIRDQAEKSGKTIDQAGMEFVKTNRPTSIIGRLASAEEVANLVVYTCSPLASATTGAALRVEGGIVEAIS